MADREAVSGTILGRLKKMTDQELKKFAWSQRKRAEGKKGGIASDPSKHMLETLGDYMRQEADMADEELKSRNMAKTKTAKKYYANIGNSYSASEIALEVGADNKITAFHDFEVDGKEYKAKQFLGKDVSSLRNEFGSSLQDIEEIKSWADINADESEFERAKPVSKPKKGILSQIKSASESKPTALTASAGTNPSPSTVSGGRSNQKIGALQNILQSRSTSTSGLSKKPNVRKAQLGSIFDNFVQNIQNYSSKYQEVSKKLNTQKNYSTNARTGLTKRQKRNPNMVSPGTYATELLEKLNKVKSHTFEGGTGRDGRKYSGVTVSNKDMPQVTKHLAGKLKMLAKNKNIFLGEADKSVLERLSADVVLSDTGEVTRGGKLSGKQYQITSNIDDVNVPGLMIEDTNTGNLVQGQEGGRAGTALHAEEISISGAGEAYNRSQIPGNPKVDSNRYLKPQEASKLKSSQASSLSSVTSGDEPRVNVKHRITVDGKPKLWGGNVNTKSWGKYPTLSVPRALLTAPVSQLKELMDAKNIESQPSVKSGWQQQVDRLIEGDYKINVEENPETGFLVDKDTRTDIEESKFLSSGDDPKVEMYKGDMELENRIRKTTLLTADAENLRKTDPAKADKMLLQGAMEDQMDDMQKWKEGRTSGKSSGGGVWEMPGGYDSEGNYVKQGAETKVNPPSPMESFIKTKQSQGRYGPWKAGYVFENFPMHKKVNVKGTVPKQNLSNLQPPRKPGDAVSYVIQGQELVEARKAAETNVQPSEIKPLKKVQGSTLLTSSDPVPTYNQWEKDWQSEPKKITHTKRKEGQPTVVSKKRQPSVLTSSSQVNPGTDTTVGVTEWASGERKLESTSSESMEGRKLLYQDTEANKRGVKVKIYQPIKTNALRAFPYLGLGVDIIQGLSTWKQSKKSGKEFNLGSFIPAWAKKIAYGEGIPKS